MAHATTSSEAKGLLSQFNENVIGVEPANGIATKHLEGVDHSGLFGNVKSRSISINDFVITVSENWENPQTLGKV